MIDVKKCAFQQVVQPLADIIDMRFCAFVRFKKDGSCHILSTMEGLYDHLITEQHWLTSHIPVELLAREFSYYFDASNHHPDYSNTLMDISKHFSIGSFIDFIKVTATHYDMLCLGANLSNDLALNHYLNHFPHLKMFANDLINENKRFIELETQKIKLPVCNQNQGLMQHMASISDMNKVVVHPNTQEKIYLTEVQQVYVAYLMKGFSAQEISEKVERSRRTVEFHTDNLKRKFSVKSKTELVRLLDRCIS